MKRIVTQLVVCTCLAIACAGAIAASDEAKRPMPCADHESGSLLDFWLGDWIVKSLDESVPYGTNRITKELDGCAISERWKGESGGEGRSLFFFDARNGIWEQIWVTTDTARAGGLKHKRLIAQFDDGVRFQGSYPDGDGNEILDRTTLTRLPGGRVRQTIETSRDGGETWSVGFDAIYIRADTDR